jgi:NADH-quinone oxidoreductase subunit D
MDNNRHTQKRHKSVITNSKIPQILQALETDEIRAYFDDALENQLVLNMGPQHPATHGVLRLLSLDGETVIKAVPDRVIFTEGMKRLRKIDFPRIHPHTDRMNYLSTCNNVCYAMDRKAAEDRNSPRHN